jgi:hypothetical protein
MEQTLESHEIPLKQIENDPRGAEQEYERNNPHGWGAHRKVDSALRAHILEEESHHISSNPYRHKQTYAEQAEPLYQIAFFLFLGVLINWKWRNGMIMQYC